jgi:EAL domain-containing protein (putative c-di-GMP-specific phosphodiesterase class I)
MLDDDETTLQTLHALRNLGTRISMDDFGIGYSSLGYLQSFPFDKIKIDQIFVRNLAESAGDRAIVKAVVGLAADMGMTTTAEGVETAEQVELLRREGCTEIQGYLISRPVPAADACTMLDSEEAECVAA